MSQVHPIEILFDQLIALATVDERERFINQACGDDAELLGISLATAKRRWAFARTFLYGELT